VQRRVWKNFHQKRRIKASPGAFHTELERVTGIYNSVYSSLKTAGKLTSHGPNNRVVKGVNLGIDGLTMNAHANSLQNLSAYFLFLVLDVRYMIIWLIVISTFAVVGQHRGDKTGGG
jgi:hypothetical protein